MRERDTTARDLHAADAAHVERHHLDRAVEHAAGVEVDLVGRADDQDQPDREQRR